MRYSGKEIAWICMFSKISDMTSYCFLIMKAKVLLNCHVIGAF